MTIRTIDTRDSRVVHRTAQGEYPVAVGGSGMTVIDAAGQAYLDGASGAAVSCLGYGDGKVISAIEQQLRGLAYVHSSSFTTPVYEQLADRLTSLVPGAFSRAYMVSGGSEAMETALKMARQYAVLAGRGDACLFASRESSYHGATIGTLAIGGGGGRRAVYEPLLPAGVKLDRCYAYRDKADGESDVDYGQRLLDNARTAIEAVGPDRIAAVVVETVGGTATGAAVPPPGYLRGLRALCDMHGLLLIFDEVMCGMGRTGSIFAFEQEGVLPDLVAVAKGLGAGYQPIGAVLVAPHVFAAFERSGAAFQHGQTYIGHATACAAALAVVGRLVDDGIAARVPALGDRLFVQLQARLADHPHVGDIRGRGLFAAVEFVADRASKAPFDPSRGIARALKRETMCERLICYPMSGFVDGTAGDHVMLAPAFIASEDDIDAIVDRLARAVDRAMPGRAA
ncbi:aspartate aminotransferase family protein [Rhizorhabdus wittichii]|uniref:Aspartate aminotransferase family protein n=1 Tax=Rhizorhabdus wittichii TaxID=160791 RepID=A0A975HDX3_9SPHN|nr:aspartate aminotransferase family protein [Rhizorhabdus wittichii]QTH20189.1 aspartate aminotransferase family protein [Rhizorhabdus wittichii]